MVFSRGAPLVSTLKLSLLSLRTSRVECPWRTLSKVELVVGALQYFRAISGRNLVNETSPTRRERGRFGEKELHLIKIRRLVL
jgi:hypothetical protein